MFFANFLDVSMQLFSRWFYRCSVSRAGSSKRVSMIFKDWLETCSQGSVAFILEVLSALSVGFGALAMLSLLCVFQSVPSLMHLPPGQAMRSNAKQCNPMSFCCICYLSVLCIICGPKSLRWPPGCALCYIFVQTFVTCFGMFFGTFLDASVQFLLHLFFSCSPFGGCFSRQFWTLFERLAGYMFEVSFTFGFGPS